MDYVYLDKKENKVHIYIVKLKNKDETLKLSSKNIIIATGGYGKVTFCFIRCY